MATTGWARRSYNPFDVPLLFHHREFEAWWFEIGTLAFLLGTLMARVVSALLSLDDLLSSRLDMMLVFNANVYLLKSR